MLKVYTASMRYSGSHKYDVTVMTGDPVFAPSWDLVKGLHRGKISWSEYEAGYLSLMRRSYRQNRKWWDQLLALDEIVLVCYCKTSAHCHRRLLAEILVRCGAEYRGEIK